MNEKINNTLLLALIVAICVIFCLARAEREKEIIKEIVTTDTITIIKRDTIRIAEPRPYKVIVRDTIEIVKEIDNGVTLIQEVKEYKDSTYYARISGINAYLEQIEVYPKVVTKYVTKTQTQTLKEKPKRWGLGVQVGCELSSEGLVPYIGLGLQYDILQF